MRLCRFRIQSFIQCVQFPVFLSPVQTNLIFKFTPMTLDALNQIWLEELKRHKIEKLFAKKINF